MALAQHGGLLGSTVHDAARRTADILGILLPWPGRATEPGGPGERASLVEVLRAYGEPGPAEISGTDLAGLRLAALQLREVFAAADAATAAERINAVLAGRAHPPRLTTHGGGSGWHLHVDGDDDAPWAEWFLTSSCLALAVLLTERQAPPGGFCASPSCGRPFVNVGRGSARHYCSATCGTRERVARHRRSETAAPGGGRRDAETVAPSGIVPSR